MLSSQLSQKFLRIFSNGYYKYTVYVYIFLGVTHARDLRKVIDYPIQSWCIGKLQSQTWMNTQLSHPLAVGQWTNFSHFICKKELQNDFKYKSDHQYNIPNTIKANNYYSTNSTNH